MGRTELITLIIRKSRSKEFIASWPVKNRFTTIPGLGKPTTKKLGEWRDKFNESLGKGGANEHLGTKHWIQCDLEVYNQKTGEIVCTYNAPTFEVIP